MSRYIVINPPAKVSENEHIGKIHSAASQGDVGRLRQFITNSSTSQLYALDKNGQSALHRVLNYTDEGEADKRFQAVTLLVDNYGFDINQTDAKGYTPLHYACMHLHHETVKFIACHAKYQPVIGPISPLHLAIAGRKDSLDKKKLWKRLEYKDNDIRWDIDKRIIADMEIDASLNDLSDKQLIDIGIAVKNKSQVQGIFSPNANRIIQVLLANLPKDTDKDPQMAIELCSRACFLAEKKDIPINILKKHNNIYWMYKHNDWRKKLHEYILRKYPRNSSGNIWTKEYEFPQPNQVINNIMDPRNMPNLPDYLNTKPNDFVTGYYDDQTVIEQDYESLYKLIFLQDNIRNKIIFLNKTIQGKYGNNNIVFLYALYMQTLSQFVHDNPGYDFNRDNNAVTDYNQQFYTLMNSSIDKKIEEIVDFEEINKIIPKEYFSFDSFGQNVDGINDLSDDTNVLKVMKGMDGLNDLEQKKHLDILFPPNNDDHFKNLNANQSKYIPLIHLFLDMKKGTFQKPIPHHKVCSKKFFREKLPYYDSSEIRPYPDSPFYLNPTFSALETSEYRTVHSKIIDHLIKQCDKTKVFLHATDEMGRTPIELIMQYSMNYVFKMTNLSGHLDKKVLLQQFENVYRLISNKNYFEKGIDTIKDTCGVDQSNNVLLIVDKMINLKWDNLDRKHTITLILQTLKTNLLGTKTNYKLQIDDINNSIVKLQTNQRRPIRNMDNKYPYQLIDNNGKEYDITFIYKENNGSPLIIETNPCLDSSLLQTQVTINTRNSSLRDKILLLEAKSRNAYYHNYNQHKIDILNEIIKLVLKDFKKEINVIGYSLQYNFDSKSFDGNVGTEDEYYKLLLKPITNYYIRAYLYQEPGLDDPKKEENYLNSIADSISNVFHESMKEHIPNISIFKNIKNICKAFRMIFFHSYELLHYMLRMVDMMKTLTE